MKLKFIGEDGSMGLRTGEVYDTRIFIKGENCNAEADKDLQRL